MKKSKFLKKSLAMLLALMLVVAMIPLSASALEGVTVNVDSKPATAKGTEYTAEASGYTVAISATVPEGATFVLFDKDGKDITSSAGSVDLKEKAKDEGNNVYSLTFQAQTKGEDNDDILGDVCTLKITVKESSLSSDATIKAVKIDDMSSYEITDSKITVYMPFGVALPSDLTSDTEDKFIPTSDKAQSVTYNDGKKTLTVTAENGSTKVYTVELKNNPGFETFSVTGQVGDSTITANGTTNEVKADVAFGTDLKNVVPTFTLGSTITKVTTEINGEEVEVKSGVTALEFIDKNPRNFKLYVGANDKTGVTVQVTLTAKANTEAELTSIKVDTSNSVDVTDTTVSVEMPAGYFDGTLTGKSVTGVASKGATVSIPAQSGVTDTASGTDGKFTLSGVDLTGKTFIVRVKAAEGDAYTDYTVNLTAAAKAQALLGDISVKTKNAAGEEVTYTTVWSGNTGTLTLPYSAKIDTNLADYTVYNPNHSTGATVSPAITSGTTTLDTLFNTNESVSITVTNGDVKNTYTIKLAYETAKTQRVVTSAEATSEKKVSAMDDDNTYDVNVGTGTNASDNKSVKTLKVNVPYSFVSDNDIYFSNLKLSDGAVAYWYDGSAAEEITTLDLTKYGEQSAATGVKLPVTDVLDSNGKLTNNADVQVFVVSEKIYVDTTAAGTTIDNTWFTNPQNAGSFTTYYIYGVKAPAKLGHDLNTLTGTLEKNNQTYPITSEITNGKVKIILPASYPTDSGFYLDFTASSQAKVEAVYSGGSVELPKDYSTNPKAGMVWYYNDEFQVRDSSDAWHEVTDIKVTNEAGTESSNYELTVEIAKAETEALLTSVKVNNTTASINNTEETVTAFVPFGTKLTMAKLALEGSKMATIEVNGSAYDADKTYDVSDDVKITVTSEDQNTKKVYTLKVTVADQFSDIDENDWYYANVMRAVELGILSGYSDGTFRPMNNITRRDFAIMLAQALGHSNDEPATSPFKDVADNDYGVSSIAYLYEQKITVGDDKGNFNPDDNITRQEAAIFLAKAFEATGTTSDLYTDDAKIASWAKDFVYAAKAAGLMNGDTNGTFRPTSTLTRAEAASAMVNAVDN
jgi:hypothetical protein